MLDPHAAEQVLLAYLTDEEIGDIDAGPDSRPGTCSWPR
jgi:hypothetical protein